MLYYKIDVLRALKDAGYTTTRIKKEGALGGSTVDKLKRGDVIGVIALDYVCALLHAQPGDLIGWQPDPPKAD